jgi:hypothetical protein
VGESADTPNKLRVRQGLGFVQVLRPALYALLAASALFTFWAGGEMARALPAWMQRVAPTLFGVFLVIFTVYRLALVRARRYPAAIGFFQIGLGALIWVLLLPSIRQKIGPHPSAADEVQALLGSGDARVRAMAAEVAGYRQDGSRYAAGLIDHLADGDAQVRHRARESLVRIAGFDAAPGEEGAAAQEKWRAAAKQRGFLR